MSFLTSSMASNVPGGQKALWQIESISYVNVSGDGHLMNPCHSGWESLNGSLHQEVRNFGHFGIVDYGGQKKDNHRVV